MTADTNPPAPMLVLTNRRNHYGVKNSCDLYRTFGGETYPQWTSDVRQDRIDHMRAAGIRVRRVKDEVFVHHADWPQAEKLESERGWR